MFRVVTLLVVPALCSCFVGPSGPDWDGLKVRWGVGGYVSVPRTRNEAEAYGWTNMAPGVACDGNPLFRGERYWKSGELNVILIYGPAGYIAGIQAGIAENYSPNPNGFPSSYKFLVDHPFMLDDGIYYITAYFTNPGKICNGRTLQQFTTEGTGVGLWIQNGTDPVTQSVRAPPTKKKADKSVWTGPKCFFTMGNHYWYNTTQDMSCERFYPVFLLYNNGKLDSFGWAFAINLQDYPLVEHPPVSSYPIFLDPIPDCFSTLGTITTLHIFMTQRPYFNLC